MADRDDTEVTAEVQRDPAAADRAGAAGGLGEAAVGGNRPYWQLPVPVPQDRIVGGIAAGIAREIGVESIWVRLAFVLLFVSGGCSCLVVKQRSGDLGCGLGRRGCGS